jgi:hypothetical protein
MSIGEKQKEKIDEIALAMVDQTKKYVSIYFYNLQSKKHSLSLDDAE